MDLDCNLLDCICHCSSWKRVCNIHHRNKKDAAHPLRSTANVFICSLAISDMGVGISSFVPGAYFLNYFVSSDRVLQETCDFLTSIFYSASVLNLFDDS